MRELLEEAFNKTLEENMEYAKAMPVEWHIKNVEEKKKKGLPRNDVATEDEKKRHSDLCDIAIKAHQAAKSKLDKGQDAGKETEHAMIANGRIHDWERQHKNSVAKRKSVPAGPSRLLKRNP